MTDVKIFNFYITIVKARIVVQIPIPQMKMTSISEKVKYMERFQFYQIVFNVMAIFAIVILTFLILGIDKYLEIYYLFTFVIKSIKK